MRVLHVCCVRVDMGERPNAASHSTEVNRNFQTASFFTIFALFSNKKKRVGAGEMAQ